VMELMSTTFLQLLHQSQSWQIWVMWMWNWLTLGKPSL
jgi:hypothetical protein